MKYFVVSDVHGFYSILKDELDKAGFIQNNKNHTLIICGDLFDRGPEAYNLLRYLNATQNKIIVRGNHEDLMLSMIERKAPGQHDVINGTYDTAMQLAQSGNCNIDYRTLSKIFDQIVEKSVDYYETKHYIFVHGFIPVKCNDILPDYYARNRNFEYDVNWKNGNWKQARWINGIDAAIDNLNETGKTIICGHWHCSYGHHITEGTSEFKDDAIWDPWKYNNVIAIDRCTAHTHQINLLTIED